MEDGDLVLWELGISGTNICSDVWNDDTRSFLLISRVHLAIGILKRHV